MPLTTSVPTFDPTDLKLDQIYGQQASGHSNFIVFVTTLNRLVFQETEYCRHVFSHSVGGAVQAAREAIRICKHTSPTETMIAEVFVHGGQEFRFAYKLTEVTK